MVRKKKGPFKVLSRTSIGLGGLAVVTGVSAAAAGRASAGTAAAPMMSGFTTISQAAPIATTVSVGGGLLGQLKQMNKPRKRKRR